MQTLTNQQACSLLDLDLKDLLDLAWRGDVVYNGDGYLSKHSVESYKHRVGEHWAGPITQPRPPVTEPPANPPSPSPSPSPAPSFPPCPVKPR